MSALALPFFMSPPVVEPHLGAAPSHATRGAVASFDDLYEAHFDFVSRTLWRLGVPSAHLDDATQDVFLVVHRRLAEFDGRSSAKTWLFQIARRVAHDVRRLARRKGGLEPLPDAGVIDHAETPQASAERRQHMAVLEKLLDTLDDDKREVLVLAELEQMSAPEMAEALGLNVNTVYSRLRLAREAFNAAVARYQRSTAR